MNINVRTGLVNLMWFKNSYPPDKFDVRPPLMMKLVLYLHHLVFTPAGLNPTFLITIKSFSNNKFFSSITFKSHLNNKLVVYIIPGEFIHCVESKQTLFFFIYKSVKI